LERGSCGKRSQEDDAFVLFWRNPWMPKKGITTLSFLLCCPRGSLRRREEKHRMERRQGAWDLQEWLLGRELSADIFWYFRDLRPKNKWLLFEVLVRRNSLSMIEFLAY
jgi:hypothetical protein